MRVIWAPSALRQIAHIHDYVADFNPGAAARLVQGLLDAGASLAEFPQRGRLVGGEIRELTILSPYIIRYRIGRDAVRILRVRHGMRS